MLAVLAVSCFLFVLLVALESLRLPVRAHRIAVAVLLGAMLASLAVLLFLAARGGRP